MRISKSLLSSFVTSTMALSLVLAPGSTQAATTVSAGDLIRGTSFSAVYYMGADGFRYTFPNDKAYFTWYSNFDTVKVIADTELSKIQLGGNVTYRPGVKMIKISSDPKTYAVGAGGTLRHVSSEAVAVALYGATWNRQIDDVPDGFFSNYTMGTAITDASQFVPATVRTTAANIGADKGLIAPKNMNITESGYSPVSVTIEAGQSVRFTNAGTGKHSAQADDLSWGSGTIKPGESFIHTFEEAGTYTFFDNYDSSNTGAVFVE
jgi:plastocyanin